MTQLSGNVQLGCYKKSGTGGPLHTQEPVTVASFRTWRGWRERVARDRCLTYPILTFVKKSTACVEGLLGRSRANRPVRQYPTCSSLLPRNHEQYQILVLASLEKVSATVPLPVAINRYFELALYLLVFTGFATLASTGGLDIPTVVAVSAALLVRGYTLTKRRVLVIPEHWTAVLTVIYVAFYLVDYLSISGNFFSTQPST